MNYLIYKITNKINHKYYIGMHKTNNINDGYMGSGKLIKAAIKKYGLESFIKEILFIFDNESDMKEKEKELVIISEQTYNLCPGGHGGFGYINANLHKWKGIHQRGRKLADRVLEEKYGLTWRTIVGKKGFKSRREKYPELSRKVAIRGNKEGWFGFKDRKHSPETIKKMQKSKNVGKQNSQFGTCWICNEEGNKKIQKKDLDIYLNLGYVKGRIMHR